MSSASFREEDRLSVAERNNKIPVFILGLRGLEPSSHSRVYGNFSRDFPILPDILYPCDLFVTLKQPGVPYKFITTF